MYYAFIGSHLRVVTDADDDTITPDTTVQPLGRHIANKWERKFTDGNGRGWAY